MRQVTLNNVQCTPVWNEVKNWSNDQKHALITLLYTTMDDIHTNDEVVDEEMHANKLSSETLSACVEMALKDHELGRTIPHSALMERIKVQRGWK